MNGRSGCDQIRTDLPKIVLRKMWYNQTYMDFSGERLSYSFERVVVGNKFPLFRPERTMRDESRLAYNTNFTLSLNIPGIPEILVDAYTSYSSGHTEKHTILVPFNPELGYTIDDRDFDLESRKDKAKASMRETPSGIFHPRAGSSLLVQVISPETTSILNPSTRLWEILPSSYLGKLRLALFFPTGIAVMAESKAYARPDALLFSDFYPLDSQPLASPKIPLREYDEIDWTLRPGLSLYLPDNMKELEEITARFILLPNQAET